jgi:phosphoribosylamine--glycine ligase
VLPLLEGDLLEIMLSCANGTLGAAQLKNIFFKGAAACVIMASGGYPETYQTGFVIQGIADAITREGITIHCAGVAEKKGELVTAGGRVLGVTAKADTLKEALARAYRTVTRISFEHAHYRKDIGGTAL